MPTSPDNPDAEDRSAATRETVPRDGSRPDGQTDVRHQDTVRVQVRPSAPGRETVMLDRDGSPLRTRETVAVPRQRTPERGGRAPLPVAAVFATLWAALTSYLPVASVLALAQLSESSGTFAGSLRLGLAGWLLGHGVPVTTSIGPLALAPLLLSALIAWRLVRAGVHLTRAMGARRSGRVRDAGLVGLAVGIGYGL